MRAFEVEKTKLAKEIETAQTFERQRMQELRSELLHRTVQAQESERQRIALELHDGLGQLLTALGMGLRAVIETLRTNPNRAVQQAQHLEGLVADGVSELRRMVSGLHPPQLDDLGLLAALRWYASEVTNRFNLPVQVTTNGHMPVLQPEVRIVIFRIAQEAITNIIRHSHATRASVHLESDHTHLRLLIEDNGKGFDFKRVLEPNPSQPNWGLMGMLERARLVGGTCNFHSILSIGTTVEFSLPITPGENNESDSSSISR
jgi:signal transduction histidine kinase